MMALVSIPRVNSQLSAKNMEGDYEGISVTALRCSSMYYVTIIILRLWSKWGPVRENKNTVIGFLFVSQDRDNCSKQRPDYSQKNTLSVARTLCWQLNQNKNIVKSAKKLAQKTINLGFLTNFLWFSIFNYQKKHF